MDSRKSGSQRQRSASMFTNQQLANFQANQQQIENFGQNFIFTSPSVNQFLPTTSGFESNSLASAQFPSFDQPIQSYMQQQMQPQIARPYHNITTPFPLDLDKRYKNEERINILGKQKGRQKAPSENVRCFWALLSLRPSEQLGNITFLHLDETLETLLGYSVEPLIGTSMIDFIHPNEANMIQSNILQYISEKSNKGKMIRCTMRSITSIGKDIHSSSSSSQNEEKMQFYSFNSDYQLIDLRLELIGDEMMLCFFHAVQDGDQSGKNQWPTGCETSLDIFDDQGCQTLWHHIFSKKMTGLESHQRGFPTKIFQILSNGSRPNILFSWPPPRLYDSMLHQTNRSGIESYSDGSYFADIFARSAFETNYREENPQNLYTCTRRQTKVFRITIDGLRIEFEAMIIPHGDIKFAVFSIFRAEYVTKPVEDNPFAQSNFATTNSNQEQNFYPQSQQNQSFPMTIPSFQSMAAAPNPFFVQAPQMFYSMPTARMIDNAELSEYGRRASLQIDSSTSHLSTSMTSNEFSQIQPNQTQKEDYGRQQDSMSSSYPIHRSNNKYFESPSKKCLTCGTSKSPEWRKGPDGNKSLCNACGLRFSRNASRVKKKEEKARNAAEVAANGGVIPIHLRKKFEAERDRKKVSMQKHTQSNITQQQQQPQIAEKAESTSFANLSPELDIQIPSSMLASSSELDTNQSESINSIDDNLIPDYDMDINDEFN